MELKTVICAGALAVLLGHPAGAATVHVAPVAPHASGVLAQPVLGQEITDQVTTLLRQAEADCARLPVEYRVDCLRQGIRTANAKIQRRPDYRAASQELRTVERALDAIVKANLDRQAPVARVRGKRVRAVRKAVVGQVNAQGRQVITESATRLLRSSGSAESVAQISQIAQAVDSTKRILRS